jgi:hypothetical protein
MENKIIKIYNKKTGEVGFKWQDVILSFYDAPPEPIEITLNPILFWLESQEKETLREINHILIDVDTKTINVFYISEKKPLSGGTVPRGYTIETFENFPYGALSSKNKLPWHTYGKDYWTDKEPTPPKEPKNLWRNFERKDIWDDFKRNDIWGD